MKNLLCIALLATILLYAHQSCAEELVITSPVEGSVINNAATFTAKIQRQTKIVAIEWQLNGRSISGSLMTPPDFAQPWHAAEVFNGPMSLQAIGLDADGKVVSTSKPVHFTAALGPGDMKLAAPETLARPLSGTVKFTVMAIRPLSDAERQQRKDDPKFDQSQINKTVECIQIFVDGELMKRQFGSPVSSMNLDTTRLSDGPHELMVSAYGWFKGIPPVGMLQTTFITDNGSSPMALLPEWQELVLQPGQTASLNPHIVCANAKVEPLKLTPVYESSDPAVVTVDKTGLVSAVAKGVATIKLSMPARSLQPGAAEKADPLAATTRVVVGLPDGLPHFTRDGRILLQYDPKHSIFVRSMFMLSPKYVVDTPGLADLVKDAGVNSCESGFFFNPNDGSHTDSLDKYIAGWDPWFQDNIVDPCRKLGVSMILTGDDWVRTTNELKWTATTPWAGDLARYIWTKLRDSGVITSVEMMDEASFLGNSPAPTDGHWAKNDPSIHDDALVNLINAIFSVQNHTPITWPVLGLAGPETAHNWMGDPRYADYASQYWTTMDWRLAYPWGESGMQMKSDLARVMVGRFPLMQWDRPELMLVSGCGPYYTKKVAGDHFHPGLDEGNPSENPSTLYADQPLYAAISGAAGVRMYSVDFSWKEEREQAKIGAGGLQTGASPYGAGSNRWYALSAAFNLIGRLQPYILQPQVNAVAMGPDFSVAARAGKDSRLLMAINWSEKPRTVTVNLEPYQMPGAKIIERYCVLGASSSVDLLPDASQETLTFQPGEFFAWLIKSPGKDAAADTVPPAVRLVLPYEPTIAGPITLRAEARGYQKIKQVEFFVNTKSIGVVTRPPYKVIWNGATPLKGEWIGLKAVATDTAGNQSESRAMIRVEGAAPTR